MLSSYFVLKMLLLRRMKYSQGLHSLLEMERFVLSVNRPFGKFAKEALAKQERRILVSNRSNNVFDSNPTDGEASDVESHRWHSRTIGQDVLRGSNEVRLLDCATSDQDAYYVRRQTDVGCTAINNEIQGYAVIDQTFNFEHPALSFQLHDAWVACESFRSRRL